LRRTPGHTATLKITGALPSEDSNHDISILENILVRKTEGKRTLRRPRHRWEDKIRMETEWKSMEWMYLAHA
jgi:hypothetical protein